MSELSAAIYDPVVAPLEVLGLRRWRQWAVSAGGAPANDSRPARRVLEIGIGTGANLAYHSAADIVAAVDPDSASLRRAAAKLNGRGGSIGLHQARAEELPFADGAFDAVIGTLTFCTIADPARGLREAHRVLKTGGTLRLVEHVRAPNRALAWIQEVMTPGWKIIADGCHLDRDTATMVERAGFHLRSVQARVAGILIGIDAVK